MNIGIYGIGNFGYAWLKHFEQKNNTDFVLRAYDINPTVVQSLQKKHLHPFLYPNIPISSAFTFVDSPQQLVEKCDVVLLAVTSDATREVIQSIRPYLPHGVAIVNTAKALDYKTGKRLSEIVAEELNGMDYTYALLSGGTIAKDLFAHESLGIDIACENEKILPQLVQLFSSSNLGVYPSTDLVGVEYAGAMKNIIAILAGIVHGMGLSYGSETHVISRAAGEIEHVVTQHFGGQKTTFSVSSQCWGNDLWMSCTGNTRNREFGILLGQGMSVNDALQQMNSQHKTVEGVKTISAINQLPEIHTYPLLAFLYTFIVEKNSTLKDLHSLLFSNSF